MFTSIINSKATSYDEETIPKSSSPWVWVGFLFAGAFFIVGVSYGVLEALEAAPDTLPLLNGILIAIGIISLIYWLFCVHRIHKILKELTNGRYPNSPGEAVIKHFIPILSIIWIFQWPAELSNYINERGRVKMISGHVVGAMLLLAMIVRFVDGSFGTAFLFGVTMYVSAKVKKHVKTLKGVTAEQLPPLPDPSIFSRPLESSVTPMSEVIKEPSAG
jgi:hypothetical protein